MSGEGRNQIQRSHSKLRDVFVLTLMVLLLASCIPSHSILHFREGDRMADALKRKFQAGDLRVYIEGGVSPGMYVPTFEIELRLTIKTADSALLGLRLNAARAFYQGESLAVMQHPLEPFAYDSEHRAYALFIISGDLDPRISWAGEDHKPVPQDISIILDSVFVWKGQPLVFDTIHAVVHPRPYRASYGGD